MDNLLKSDYITSKQKDRIIKGGYQSFYLLKTTFIENGVELKISGSTLNIYTVVIKNFRIKCDCPDYDFCYKHNLYCKHICFVIYFIGNINDVNIFINKVLSIEQYDNIISRLKINCSDDPNIINSFLSKKFEDVIHDKEEIIARNLEDDCPICFTTLNENEHDTCHKCLNAVHKECNKKWFDYNNTCIFCRNIKPKNAYIVNGYINISK